MTRQVYSSTTVGTTYQDNPNHYPGPPPQTTSQTHKRHFLNNKISIQTCRHHHSLRCSFRNVHDAASSTPVQQIELYLCTHNAIPGHQYRHSRGPDSPTPRLPDLSPLHGTSKKAQLHATLTLLLHTSTMILSVPPPVASWQTRGLHCAGQRCGF